MNPDFLTERQLAERWNKTPRSLYNWRKENKGRVPPHFTIGKSGALYRLADVVAFERENFRAAATTEQEGA
jgi:hypothetical protein